MKQFFLAAILSLIASVAVQSQNKIQFSDNAYLNADEQLYILTEIQNIGQAGPDQVWDFSDIKNHGEVISYLKPVAESPFADKCREANMLIQEEHQSWLIRATPEGLEEYGASTGQSVLIYDKPIVRFPFPFEYGSSVSGEYSGAYIHAPGNKIKGTFTTEADGSGTLILPDNVILRDIIRVRFVQQRENGSGFVTYRWYASNTDPILRYPLLSVIYSLNNDKMRVIRAAYFADAALLMQKEEPYNAQESPYEYISVQAEPYELKVYPNPFVDYATIEFSVPDAAHISLQVYDNLGRLAATLANGDFSSGRFTEKFNGNRQFIYFVRLVVNSQTVASKKLIQLQ